jgi:hypothetical protein
MKTTKKTRECPKCGGHGHIEAFSGIAGGVCFRCNGTGKVADRITARPTPPLSDYQAKMIQIVIGGDLSVMSYERLLALRDFAHWPTPHCPNLLSIWRDRGEGHFQESQAEKLATCGY